MIHVFFVYIIFVLPDTSEKEKHRVFFFLFQRRMVESSNYIWLIRVCLFYSITGTKRVFIKYDNSWTNKYSSTTSYYPKKAHQHRYLQSVRQSLSCFFMSHKKLINGIWKWCTVYSLSFCFVTSMKTIDKKIYMNNFYLFCYGVFEFSAFISFSIKLEWVT